VLNHLEHIFGLAWNHLVSNRVPNGRSDLALGFKIQDGQISKVSSVIPESRRTEHIAALGKTGTGKSSLLKQFVLQDLRNDRGFVFFDLHGDAQNFLLRAVAEEERRRKTDLSGRLIIVEPADWQYSVGLNVLEQQRRRSDFVQIAEIAQILKARWHLDALGARTEELLRNGLYVLSENALTLLELPALLTSASYRSQCLKRVSNSDVRGYFQTRYDPLSGTMQQSFREAVLNKITAFTADPQFRHILGQQESTFSIVDAIDNGHWMLLNLDKGRLGEQALTLGSLFLSKLKTAVFSRRSRRLFTLYCDEIQNLVGFNSGIDTLFSESRKFSISVVSSNQFLEQYPTQIKAAILAVGTHVLFQLSTDDATKMAAALGGGRHLAELLRHLPHRQMVVKTGSMRWSQVQVKPLPDIPPSDTNLYDRCRRRWARLRTEVEREINVRAGMASTADGVLDDWE
jgi:hypothetical protein